MSPPTVAYTFQAYQISFTAPSNTGGVGLPIISYELSFLQADGVTYSTIPGECNGSSSAVMSAMSCLVSLSTFTSPPFNLASGAKITARARAANVLGFGAESSPSASLAFVVSAPARPS